MGNKVVILGAGLAGISTSYHVGHENCVIFEKNSFPGGHIRSEYMDGFTWDEGPHVSFTDNEYVRDLFFKSVEGELLEYPVKTTNYYKGSWIPHPAQSNLWAVPQPLRDECLHDILNSKERLEGVMQTPENYQRWLEAAFGKVFTNHFPKLYTEKYWTLPPEELATDWLGVRIFNPNIEQVRKGYLAPLPEETHYIKKIRYPRKGGYFSFAKPLYDGANVSLGKELVYINFTNKELHFADDTSYRYDRLISTIPLPELIKLSNAPIKVKEAASMLTCTSLLLVNVAANHPTKRKDNWIYVYDENKFSTRINCTELLSPENAPFGKTGIQVEVYFSQHKPKKKTDEFIAQQVVRELVDMELIESIDAVESYHTKWVPWANVVFDNQRRELQDTILSYLQSVGLEREEDDLEPMTKWSTKMTVKLSALNLAGRFGQWKYYWTDDCVLRGYKFVNE